MTRQYSRILLMALAAEILAEADQAVVLTAHQLLIAGPVLIATLSNIMEIIEKYLRERIRQLNEADAAFCKDRWDMDKPEMLRKLAREHSNAVTLARQELENCLQILGLPRFVEPPDRSKESHEEAVKRYLDHPKDETLEERQARINRFRCGF
jgi:hypothetical protein